jgi:hypothetical protein
MSRDTTHNYQTWHHHAKPNTKEATRFSAIVAENHTHTTSLEETRNPTTQRHHNTRV